jgi:hypothetical protein
MKIRLLTLALLVSTSVHAQQYIQPGQYYQPTPQQYQQYVQQPVMQAQYAYYQPVCIADANGRPICQHVPSNMQVPLYQVPVSVNVPVTVNINGRRVNVPVDNLPQEQSQAVVTPVPITPPTARNLPSVNKNGIPIQYGDEKLGDKNVTCNGTSAECANRADTVLN